MSLTSHGMIKNIIGITISIHCHSILLSDINAALGISQLNQILVDFFMKEEKHIITI